MIKYFVSIGILFISGNLLFCMEYAENDYSKYYYSSIINSLTKLDSTDFFKQSIEAKNLKGLIFDLFSLIKTEELVFSQIGQAKQNKELVQESAFNKKSFIMLKILLLNFTNALANLTKNIVKDVEVNNISQDNIDYNEIVACFEAISHLIADELFNKVLFFLENFNVLYPDLSQEDKFTLITLQCLYDVPVFNLLFNSKAFEKILGEEQFTYIKQLNQIHNNSSFGNINSDKHKSLANTSSLSNIDIDIVGNAYQNFCFNDLIRRQSELSILLSEPISEQTEIAIVTESSQNSLSQNTNK